MVSTASLVSRLLGPVIPSASYLERQVSAEYENLLTPQNKLPLAEEGVAAELTCPSYPRHLASKVLAVKRRFRLAFSFNPETIKAQETTGWFGNRAIDSSNVRVSGRCISTGCVHWTGATCRLGTAVASVQIVRKPVEHCSIRASCRWFNENSYSACRACQYLPYSKLFDTVDGIEADSSTKGVSFLDTRDTFGS